MHTDLHIPGRGEEASLLLLCWERVLLRHLDNCLAQVGSTHHLIICEMVNGEWEVVGSGAAVNLGASTEGDAES